MKTSIACLVFSVFLVACGSSSPPSIPTTPVYPVTPLSLKCTMQAGGNTYVYEPTLRSDGTAAASCYVYSGSTLLKSGQNTYTKNDDVSVMCVLSDGSFMFELTNTNNGGVEAVEVDQVNGGGNYFTQSDCVSQ